MIKKSFAVTSLVLVPACGAFLFLASAFGGEPLDLLMAALIAAMFGALAICGISRQLDELSERIKADAPLRWEATVDGVVIGSLSDKEVASMKAKALCDARIAGAQLLNVGRCVLNGVGLLISAVPVWTFWAAIVSALLVPEVFTQIVNEMRAADPSVIASAIRRYAPMGLQLGALAVATTLCMGYRHGFENLYAQAVDRLVLQHFDRPTGGDVHLVRQEPCSAVRNA